MDFSFEKTNSAYMLFYERRLPDHLKEKHAHLLASPTNTAQTTTDLKQLGDTTKAEALENNASELQKQISSKMDEDVIDGVANNCDNEKTKIETADGKENPERKVEQGEQKELEMKASDKGNTAKAEQETETPSTSAGTSICKNIENRWRPQLSKELEDWIWQDNRQFLQDRNIFEHTYFK